MRPTSESGTGTLSCREDWPEAAERMARWWKGDYLGRPAMHVTAPRSGAVWCELAPAPDLWQHWTNPDYVVPRTEQTVCNTAWFGEACPQSWVNLGPVSQAGYLGTGLHAMPQTIWQSPIVDDWEAYEPQFDPANEWWQITRRLTQAMLEAAQGRWFVANADLAEATDVMSYLRGPERLCIDLLEARPATLRRVRDQLIDLLIFFYDDLTKLVAPYQQGTSSWLGVWSPGRTSTLQCDFSCMISKPLFDEFVLPGLVALSRHLDHIIYHLDGPGAIHHVDSLLQIPRLHAIQWVPGSGDESAAHPKWRPLLRRIIDAGVRVHLSVSPSDVESLLRDLPADGLFLSVTCASEDNARELLKKAEQWSWTR
ncbi:MAG: hypothetical protein AB7W28_10220 [Armatimonadota bacterium]